MTQTVISDTRTDIEIGGRTIILLGTAHVSKESTEEVDRVIRSEEPDTVCVEIDKTRYKALTEGQNWENLKITEVIKQRKGFLLLANLVLTSFQRRLGSDMGTVPGQEMLIAVNTARELGKQVALCDREIQVTLRRAWGRSGFWGKNKLMAALLSSVFSSEKLNEEELEKLKKKSVLQDMMEELAGYLPNVKEVLIDERDRYLASKIFSASGDKRVAVIGAGHMEGIVSWLERFEKEEASLEVASIEEIPPKSRLSKVLPYIIPVAVAGLIVAGFFRSGWSGSLEMLGAWIILNGSLAALGAAAALAHPLTIILSFLAAPVTSMNPTIGVGIVSGVIEGLVRKPRVFDFENLHSDILSVKGFYKNRVTRALLVFFLSSVGSAIGTFIAFPYLTKLLAF